VVWGTCACCGDNAAFRYIVGEVSVELDSQCLARLEQEGLEGLEHNAWNATAIQTVREKLTPGVQPRVETIVTPEERFQKHLELSRQRREEQQQTDVASVASKEPSGSAWADLQAALERGDVEAVQRHLAKARQRAAEEATRDTKRDDRER
jgi:hypothetical protein